MINCGVTFLSIVVLIFIFIYVSAKEDTRYCSYFTSENGKRVILTIKNIRDNFPTDKESLEEYLKSRGLSQGQIDLFFHNLCKVDNFNGCGLQQQEIYLLKRIKSISCVLWKCRNIQEELNSCLNV